MHGDCRICAGSRGGGARRMAAAIRSGDDDDGSQVDGSAVCSGMLGCRFEVSRRGRHVGKQAKRRTELSSPKRECPGE